MHPWLCNYIIKIFLNIQLSVDPALSHVELEGSSFPRDLSSDAFLATSWLCFGKLLGQWDDLSEWNFTHS